MSPRLSQAGTQPTPRAAEGPREGLEARGSGTHCPLFRAGCGVAKYRKRVPTGSQTPQLGPLPFIGHQTHRRPCLRTGWAPSPGTSASCPCGGGSGGGGGLRPGWRQRGPGRHCRAVPRGDAAAPVWRWSASWGWCPEPAVGGMWTARPEGAPGGQAQDRTSPMGGTRPTVGVRPQKGPAVLPGVWQGLLGPPGPSLTPESSSPPESHPFFKSTLHDRQLCACLALRPGREQKPSLLGVRVTSHQNKSPD